MAVNKRLKGIGVKTKKYTQPTKSQIGQVQSLMEEGAIKIFDPSFGDVGIFENKKQNQRRIQILKSIQAQSLIKKASQLAATANVERASTQRGEYTTLERYDVDQEQIASRILRRKFGRPEDYIELHIYDIKDTLLRTIQDFDNYQIYGEPSVDGLTNQISIDPYNVLQELGYSTGKYKLVFNIQRKKIFDTFEGVYSIKEISPSRTELRVVSSKLPSALFETQVRSYISSLGESDLFRDFVLNFGGDVNELGINMMFSTKDPQNPEVLIKLFNPLPPSIKKQDSFRIVEEITDPILFQCDLGEPDPTSLGIELRGPNFKIDTRLVNSIPSEFKNFDSTLNYTLTSSYQHLLSKLENYETPEIDYDYIKPTPSGSEDIHFHFENFVHFGSAVERLKNFQYKLKLINLYDTQVADINTIGGSTSGSIAVLENKDLINNKKEKLIKGFDGYERFLYFESGTYSWPKTTTVTPHSLYDITSSQALTWLGSEDSNNAYYGGQLLSASVFDNLNYNKLEGLIPEHILENTSNEPYILFVNMVGQHFDQIWTHIHHITKQKSAAHRYGVSKELVFIALKSLGIDTFDQFENANLIEYILGEGDAGSPFYNTPLSQSLITASNDGSVPKGDITKEVYKRLFHNTPYLLKHKGTERGIKALISCYGIPSTILNVKEYGGQTNDRTTYKTFSYDKSAYALKADSGTGGYLIRTDWSSSLTPNTTAKTVTFRVKPERAETAYHLFSLSGSATSSGTPSPALYASYDTHLLLNPYTGSTDISSSQDGKQYGKLQLLTGNTLRAETEYLPIYDGDFWNIHVAAEKNTSDGDGTVYFGAYKSNFRKSVHKHDKSIAIATANDYYDMVWGTNGSGSRQAYFGGVPDNGISHYDTAGPLSYSGSLQEIRYYFGEKLTDATLTKQALEPAMYAGNSVSSSFDTLILRLPLGSNNIIKPSASSVLNGPSSSFHPSIDVDYLGTTITSSCTGPTYVEIVETHHLPTPDTVGISMTSEKTRLDTGTIDDDMLSITMKSETSTLDRQPQDFEDLGVFFSPQHEINEDIIYTLGAFRLDDYIGSPLPAEQTSSQYNDLGELRDEYFKKYKNDQRYNIWDYTKLIQYIDHTLFKIIEQHVPAKANLKTGLLIEPHYLERTKFARTLPTTDELDTMVLDSHQHFRVVYDLADTLPISASYIQTTGSICVSCEVLNEPQFGSQAPIEPAPSTGTSLHYKPYQSSTLLGNARKGRISSIYFRSLQKGKENDF